MWMCYGGKIDLVVFGGGQRSSGVTGGHLEVIRGHFEIKLWTYRKLGR